MAGRDLSSSICRSTMRRPTRSAIPSAAPPFCRRKARWQRRCQKASIKTGIQPRGVNCLSCCPAHWRSKPATEKSTDAAAVKSFSPMMSAVAAIALARSAARPACFSCICRPKPMSEANRRLGETTIAYYDRFARAFWDGTRHHDVSQNYAALLDAIESEPRYSILDLGCGPGRDLIYFRSLGHEAVGLDGSRQFVAHGASALGLRGPASGFPLDAI